VHPRVNPGYRHENTPLITALFLAVNVSLGVTDITLLTMTYNQFVMNFATDFSILELSCIGSTHVGQTGKNGKTERMQSQAKGNINEEVIINWLSVLNFHKPVCPVAHNVKSHV